MCKIFRDGKTLPIENFAPKYESTKLALSASVEATATLMATLSGRTTHGRTDGTTIEEKRDSDIRNNASENEGEPRCSTFDTRKSFRVFPVDYSATTFEPTPR
jgi:hypothetical protein